MTSAAMAARAGAAPARCQLARRIYGRSRTPRHVVVGIAAGEGQGMPRPPARAHGIGATQLACAPGGWDSGTGERVPRARTAPYRRRRRDDRGVAYSTTGERANSTGDDGLSARVSDSEDADGDRSSSGRKAASLTAALPAPPGAAGTRSSSAAGSTPPLLGVSTQRAMLAVAGPSICIGLLRTTYGLADQYWVGQLGTGAAVALGGCSYAAWIILVLCELGEMGVQAIAAYDEGAGRRERVARTIVQGCWVSAGVALALVLMMPHADLYFHALGFKPGSGEFAAGVAYLYASIVGALPLAVGAVLTAGMRGVGLLKQALGITTATVLLNILLDPVLIWGLGPFPQLGVAGAAWGTTISTLLGCVLSARVLRREGIRLRWMAPVATLVQRIVNVGSPMCVSGLLFSFVYLFIGRIANDLGAANVAALGLSHRLESVAYVVCEGFGICAATLVGQWLGARKPTKARNAANTVALFCAFVMLPMGLLAGLCAEPLLSLFTSDPAIIASATRYLQINAAVFTLMGVEVVFDGAFAGSENTKPVLYVGSTLNLLRLPAAYVLSMTCGLGIDGVWIAIALSTSLKAIYKALCFCRQRLRGEEERTNWLWVPVPWEWGPDFMKRAARARASRV